VIIGTRLSRLGIRCCARGAGCTFSSQLGRATPWRSHVPHPMVACGKGIVPSPHNRPTEVRPTNNVVRDGVAAIVSDVDGLADTGEIVAPTRVGGYFDEEITA
jgi:hypothetical protein